MANFLADVGRSNMLESVTGTISAINSMRQTDATIALSKEQIERLQRQNLAEKEEYERGEKEIALETFDILGGPDGKIAQDMYKLGKGRGFINMDAGGMGSIKAKYLPVMKKLMSEPRRALQLSLDTITHWRNELAQINKQLETKQGDQKLLQAKQKISTGLNMAMGQNAALQTELKRKATEAEAAKISKWVPTTEEEALAFEKAKKIPKTPTPVTRTTAYNKLSDRFFSRDAIGNIITTPENQGMHRIAQKKLVGLNRDKSLDLFEAVNMAEDFARNVENRYWEYLDVAKKDKARLAKIRRDYKSQYGYIPKRKMR